MEIFIFEIKFLMTQLVIPEDPQGKFRLSFLDENLLVVDRGRMSRGITCIQSQKSQVPPLLFQIKM